MGTILEIYLFYEKVTLFLCSFKFYTFITFLLVKYLCCPLVYIEIGKGYCFGDIGEEWELYSQHYYRLMLVRWVRHGLIFFIFLKYRITILVRMCK